jgi:signal transduction histidine kinase
MASPWRTLAEGLCVQLLVLAWLIWRLPPKVANPFVPFGVTAMTIAGPCVMLYCAFRLQAFHGHWWQKMAVHAAVGMTLALVPAAITSGLMVATLAGRWGSVPQGVFWIIATWYAAYAGAFLISRGGTWLLTYWNSLRRRNLIWSLTHAHLLVVVIAAVLITTAVLVPSIIGGRVSATALPILFFAFLLTCTVLVIVLPPSALFSYLFARTLTRRLERLAAATGALRAGDLDVRVPVEGVDEVAQLQADFNAMADALECALRQVQTERDTVAELLRGRRELVASVSHELRTPLATLRAYIESTGAHWSDVLPSTLRQDLSVMERETVRLQTLVEDLFMLSRAEVGRLELRPAPTDVGALARQLVEAHAPLAWQTARVMLVAEVADGVPSALVDELRLEQVVANLLQNGIRHTPAGGIVAIGVSTGPRVVVVDVCDTGEGIPAAELPYIWERFYRTEASRERPDSGSGLGLALVKELTEAMGGTVTVESTPGHGTRFSLSLPQL